MISLSQLKLGQTATIAKLLLGGALRRRLQDIGLVEHTEVEKVLSAASGDPSAYRIKGAVIALRTKDAEQILIGG